MNSTERKILCDLSYLLQEVPFVKNNCDIGGLARFAHEMNYMKGKVTRILQDMVTGEYEDAKEEMEDISEFIAQSRPEWNKPSPDVIIKKSR